MNSIHQQAISHLQNLIRINTTNPPGNEIEAIKYVIPFLKEAGIQYHVFEPQPGRASVIARIPGNGNKQPLLLTSHVDVVPAEKSKWKVDPFSGEIKDDCIWGRGAVDMKHMAAMLLTHFLEIKKSGEKLDRDLILALVADEEAGCEWGSQWLVENHPELIRAEFALNEVGGFSLPVDGTVFYPIGVAEKGMCWFKLISQGDPGHGSMPHDNQATIKLAEIIQNLGNQPLPFHAHPLVNLFIRSLAKTQKFPRNFILRALSVSWLNQFIINRIIPDKKRARSFHALYHNTVSPTVIRAGSKTNVIPSSASVEVDGRILPGQTVQKFLEEVRDIVGQEVEVEVIRSADPSEMEYKNEFFDLLASTLKKHDTRAVPVPYLIPGFTDACYYKRLGIKCYGYTPVQLPEDMSFMELFHGHNERIPVKGFLFGVDVLGEVIRLG